MALSTSVLKYSLMDPITVSAEDTDYNTDNRQRCAQFAPSHVAENFAHKKSRSQIETRSRGLDSLRVCHRPYNCKIDAE